MPKGIIIETVMMEADLAITAIEASTDGRVWVTI
jgi:hypothetical protein